MEQVSAGFHAEVVAPGEAGERAPDVLNLELWFEQFLRNLGDVPSVTVSEGIDPIPPITEFIPDFPVASDYFGILIPKDAPQEVYDTMDQVWEEHVMNADELQEYANNRGAVFAPAYGEEALERVQPVIQAEACARVDRGEAVIDPAEIGIDCPEE